MIFFLVGYMGCGKSTIGRELAGRMGMRFVDTDREIEKRQGMSVAEMFEKKGESFFRECESEVLREVCSSAGDTVVATGGGAPCHGGNMDLLKSSGAVIYLKMSPAKLAERLRVSRRRPVLNEIYEGDISGFIRENLAAREPFYSRANMIIDCDGVSDDYICHHAENYIAHTISEKCTFK